MRPLRLNPFVHAGPDRYYHPLTDASLARGDALFTAMSRVREGLPVPSSVEASLAEGRWIDDGRPDAAAAFRLKYVSLETHTVCNQACYFCPVSVDPRAEDFMPRVLFDRIVSELAPYRATIEGVFLNGYNEPTVDPSFVDQVRKLREHGLPVAVLTNGSGLTPERSASLDALGGAQYLCVNLSTLDPERYRRERGRDHLALVLDNLDHAGGLEVAERMELVVLGEGGASHRREHAAIAARFSGSRFVVKLSIVNDRAGYFPAEAAALRVGKKRLRGCEQMGSRPLQHLHVTAHCKVVLCCQDYRSSVELGDLTRSSVDDVLTGAAMAEARRWAYGIDEAPSDFLCRHCEFALTE